MVGFEKKYWNGSKVQPVQAFPKKYLNRASKISKLNPKIPENLWISSFKENQQASSKMQKMFQQFI